MNRSRRSRGPHRIVDRGESWSGASPTPRCRSPTFVDSRPLIFAPPTMFEPSSPTDQTFSTAVDHLYGSFDDVSFRADMPRCTHCVSPTDVARLGTEVRHLDPALVARFVMKAGTTWGRSDDFRRVAPRALHLAAEKQLPINRGLVLHKLAATSWAGWPSHQVDAVCRFLLAEWDRLLLVSPRPGTSAHRWLGQTASATTEIGPFLDTWGRTLSRRPGPASVHLAVLLVNSELRPDFPSTVADLFDLPADLTATAQTAPDRSGLRGGYRSSDLVDTFGAWLAAGSTEANLVRAASALTHTPDARRLTLAVDRLRRFRVARDRAA